MCVCVLMERRKMKELGVFPAVGMETTLCTTNLADSEKQNSCKWCTHNRSGVCTCVYVCVVVCVVVVCVREGERTITRGSITPSPHTHTSSVVHTSHRVWIERAPSLPLTITGPSVTNMLSHINNFSRKCLIMTGKAT